MSCKKEQENISAYFDGELDGIVSAQILSHVEECEQCSSHFKLFKMLQNKMNLQIAPKEAPPYIEAQLMRRIRMEGAQIDRPGIADSLKLWLDDLLERSRPAVRAVEFALLFLVAVIGGVQLYKAFGPSGSGPANMVTEKIQPVLSEDFVRDDLADFFAKSSRVLERIKNSKITDSTRLATERKLASELLVKSQLISHKLDAQKQQQAGRLLQELEPLLIDVANYDRQRDRRSVDLWKNTIDQNNYISRINSIRINQASFER